jgi:hypothetical protein
MQLHTLLPAEIREKAELIPDKHQRKLYLRRAWAHLRRHGLAPDTRAYVRKTGVGKPPRPTCKAVNIIRTFLDARVEVYQTINHPDHLKDFTLLELRNAHQRFRLSLKAMEDEYQRRMGKPLEPIAPRKAKNDFGITS